MSNVQQPNVNVRQWQCFYGIMTAAVHWRAETGQLYSLLLSDLFPPQCSSILYSPLNETGWFWCRARARPSLPAQSEWFVVQLDLIVIPSYICNNEYISLVPRGDLS